MPGARLLAVALLSTLLAAPARPPRQPACVAAPGAPSLDHAVVVVRSLDAAGATFRESGFRLKPGRLHPDQLLNAHVKFRDGSELELMSLAGAPGSPMARDYATRAAAGDRGAYAALRAGDVESITRAARSLGMPARTTVLGAWTFVSFPDTPDAGAIFFSQGGVRAVDSESTVAHENGAAALEAAWIEAGPAVERLLSRLGARACGPSVLPDGRTGTRWALARGAVVLVRPGAQGEFARLVGVELARAPLPSTAGPGLRQPIPGFWVLFR